MSLCDCNTLSGSNFGYSDTRKSVGKSVNDGYSKFKLPLWERRLRRWNSCVMTLSALIQISQNLIKLMFIKIKKINLSIK